MCVLRVNGEGFDPDEFLSGSSLAPCAVFRRGEPRLPHAKPDGPVHLSSGINFDVSDAEWDDVGQQMFDAEEFLRTHLTELKHLASAPGVTGMCLDFPVELRIGRNGIATQSDRFPVSLVKLAGEIGLSLEFSIYPVEEDLGE
jgi:hypothetical protein